MASTSTYFSPSGRVLYTNTGSAIAVGDLVVRATGATGCVGVAVVAIAATTGTGQLDTVGIFQLAKASGEAFTDGQIVYYDGTQVSGTNTTTSTRAGRVVGAVASATLLAYVDINVA